MYRNETTGRGTAPQKSQLDMIEDVRFTARAMRAGEIFVAAVLWISALAFFAADFAAGTASGLGVMGLVSMAAGLTHTLAISGWPWMNL